MERAGAVAARILPPADVGEDVLAPVMGTRWVVTAGQRHDAIAFEVAAASIRQAGLQDRNVVERTINKLRQTRAVATRYGKRKFVYRGTIDVASIRI